MDNNIVYGLNTIKSLLKNNINLVKLAYINKNYVYNKRILNLLEIIKKNNIPLLIKNKIELKNNININFAIKIKPNICHTSDKNKILNFINNKKKLLILVLENIQDPRNLGACLRCAEAAKVDFVILTKNNSSPITQIVRKVASGSVDNLIIFTVKNIYNIINLLKNNGIKIVGTSSKAEYSLYNVKLVLPICIIFGSESKGIKNITKKNCDIIIKIPMYGKVSSLNISVSTGICLFEIIRVNNLCY